MALKPQCTTTKTVGKRIRFDFNYDTCGNISNPESLAYVPFGGMQSKGMQRSQDSQDTTDDQTVGDYGEEIGTRKTMTISANGFMNYTDNVRSNLVKLDQLWAEEGDVRMHVRMTEPHATTYAYMVLKSYNREFPTEEGVTFDLELAVTGSDYGVKVVPTLPYAAATSVKASPTTMSIAVGDKTTITTSVLPAGAPQGVTFTSGTPANATVSPGGVITALKAGSSIITVKSVDDPSKTATVTVTVA